MLTRYSTLFCLTLFILLLNTDVWALDPIEQAGPTPTHLYINCIGTGSPVILMDAGMGRTSEDWREVQQSLASSTKTCIYDRAGYGLSSPGPEPRTSSRIAAELRTLLMYEKIYPPYLLVGHSFGGFNMRLFADFFPDETQGLVLVDTPHEDQIEAVFESVIMDRVDPNGLLRDFWHPDVLQTLSTQLEPFSALLGLDVKTFRTIVAEAIAFQESANEVRNTKLDPNLPVTAIMHGQRILLVGPEGDRLEKQWLQSQRQLIDGQLHGQLIIAEKSGHNIMFQQPELIVGVLKNMLFQSVD